MILKPTTLSELVDLLDNEDISIWIVERISINYVRILYEDYRLSYEEGEVCEVVLIDDYFTEEWITTA
jgi:hypothetical protein